jgi:hypothetical protein
MNIIGFWNVHGSVDPRFMATFCAEHKLDLLVLAELGDISPFNLAREIGLSGNRLFSYVNPNSFRVKIFSALPHANVVPLLDHQYVSVVKVAPPLGPDYLLVGVHLPSKTDQKDEDQAIIAQRISRYVREIEKDTGLRKTVVVGDFNMSPFEKGLINSDGFHAVMDRKIAAKQGRTVLFEQHPYFYNPMWGLQGDSSEGPAGTFYMQKSNPNCYFWNMFDQAIFRPDLLPYLAKIPVIIVDKIGGANLLENGVPNSKISDHLPIKIFFKSQNEVLND